MINHNRPYIHYHHNAKKKKSLQNWAWEQHQDVAVNDPVDG